jgi:hypothetical protein
MRLTLPDRARNPLSLAGVAIATAMAVVFLVLFVLHIAGLLASPYIGLLIFLVVPALFLLGLALIPLGAWRAMRRGDAPTEWPVVDFRNPRHRTTALAIFALTAVNVVIVSLAAYGGVHYMDSTQFCTQACHTIMEPQAVAHQRWPHANVACTQCHIGSGAEAFVEAKLAGTRQLYQVVTGQVPRPVPPPHALIRPRPSTCEQCHSRQMRDADTVRAVREFGNDEANTETVTLLRLLMGTPATPGIHRHIDMEIEFVAADSSNETILAVRSRGADGVPREFAAPDATPEALARGVTRRMDCTDCHNRAAHTFAFTPQRAVDAALADGRVPRGLRFVRREAVAAVSAEYPDHAAAIRAIRNQLTTFYDGGDADLALVEAAIRGTQDVWESNVFPRMKVTWGTYPNHLGHVETPGCFRCHDDRASADGRTISQDFELCHRFE